MFSVCIFSLNFDNVESFQGIGFCSAFSNHVQLVKAANNLQFIFLYIALRFTFYYFFLLYTFSMSS